MGRRLVLLLPLLLQAVALPWAAHAAPWTYETLRMEFERRGYAVRDDHPRCQRERDLYGLYVRGYRVVVVCQRGNRAESLLHEGWHLVQSLCLKGEPWLGDDTLRRQLTRNDRRDLAMVVSPSNNRREAEARLMARINPADYFSAMDMLCPQRSEKRLKGIKTVA